MSGFNALAVRLARSRRKLEQERALVKAIVDERRKPECAGAAMTGEVAHLPNLLPPGSTNVIVLPRR